VKTRQQSQRAALILLDLREECVLEATGVVEMWSEMVANGNTYMKTM
jgi:hypothetical protein